MMMQSVYPFLTTPDVSIDRVTMTTAPPHYNCCYYRLAEDSTLGVGVGVVGGGRGGGLSSRQGDPMFVYFPVPQDKNIVRDITYGFIGQAIPHVYREM